MIDELRCLLHKMDIVLFIAIIGNLANLVVTVI
jgi:hypothetical protein